jgi:prepilin-type N-terminal cleavage/methylation domain-containing protein
MFRSKKKSRGFTLIELMIVISMMLILVSIAIPAYNQSILRAKEGVLRQDLLPDYRQERHVDGGPGRLRALGGPAGHAGNQGRAQRVERDWERRDGVQHVVR